MKTIRAIMSGLIVLINVAAFGALVCSVTFLENLSRVDLGWFLFASYVLGVGTCIGIDALGASLSSESR
jgi:hypothetical protein